MNKIVQINMCCGAFISIEIYRENDKDERKCTSYVKASKASIGRLSRAIRRNSMQVQYLDMNQRDESLPYPMPFIYMELYR